MASDPKYPKLKEDFSPSVKISEVLDIIKDLYFGAGYCSILTGLIRSNYDGNIIIQYRHCDVYQVMYISSLLQ